MKKRAEGAVILAGILWGVINIFIRKMSAGGMSSFQIASMRSLMTAAVFAAGLLIIDRRLFRIRLKDLWMFVGTGVVSVTLFNVLYFYTIIGGQASVAVVLLYTSPVFVMLMSAVLFKERITKFKILALVLTLLGCVLVSGILTGSLTVPPMVLLTGILSGFFYGLYTIFCRPALKKYDSLTVTFWSFVFAALGGIPLGHIPETLHLFAADPSLALWSLGGAVICSVLPYFFYTWGLQRMESGRAAIMVAVEPLVGAVIGMTIFHESVRPTKLTGIILILAAIIVLNLPEKTKTER